MYNGNPLLKPANFQYHYSNDEIKEYIKCEDDFLYFCTKYCLILNLDAGKLVPFQPYPYQVDMADMIINNKFFLGKLPRQSGKSTIMAALIAWYTVFKDRHTTLIAAHKHDTAIEIMGRVKEIIENLPWFLQPGVIMWNQLEVAFENGSRIKSAATSEGAARGLSINFLLLDEFAFVDGTIADKFYTSVYPTISSGKNTKLCIISTPNGMNHFYKMCRDAEDQRSDFKYKEIHWSDVPGRDEAWKQIQISNIGESKFFQEFAAEFVGGEHTLISPYILSSIAYFNPIDMREEDHLKIFREPDKNASYFIMVDCSEGLGKDSNAFVVFDISKFPIHVVAHYSNPNISNILLPGIIYNVARHYNDATILVEINKYGTEVTDILFEEFEYDNLLGCMPNGKMGQKLTNFSAKGKGIKVSTATKRVGCSNLKSYIENRKIQVNSWDIIQELSNFVAEGNSYAATEGNHDDLCMCLVNFAWCLTQPFMKSMMDHGIREVFEDQLSEIENTLVPAGYFSETFDDEDLELWREDF